MARARHARCASEPADAQPHGGALLGAPIHVQLLTTLSVLQAVVIAEGAHHLDLMFSQPDDPPSVTLARIVELQQISSWIAEYRVQAAERRAFRAEQEAS